MTLRKTKSKKAALYIRVSTDMQADKDSLPLQESDLIKLAEFHGITDYVVFKDAGFSGKNFKRPSLQDMLERIRNGEFTHLLVWKLDRISRNLIDFMGLYEELKRRNVSFVSKCETFDTSSVGGEVMLKILLVFAEMERKTIVERVTAVMLSRANDGKWNGGPVPFGYTLENGPKAKVKKWPVPDPVEAPIVKKMFEAYLKLKTLRKVAQMLNEQGITTRQGNTWCGVTVREVLFNAFYKGVYTYNKTSSNMPRESFMKPESEWISVKGKHEAIVSEELFDKCSELMHQQNRSFTSKIGRLIGAQEKYIFGGLLACANCGYTLRSVDRGPKKDECRQSSYYYCAQRYDIKKPCTSKAYTSDKILVKGLLTLVSRIIEACGRAVQFSSPEQLVKYLLSDDIIAGAKGIEEADNIYTIIRTHVKHTYGVDNVEEYNPNSMLVDKIDKEIKVMQRALERLNKFYLFDDSAMPEQEFAEQKKSINEKIAKLEEQKVSLSCNDVNEDAGYLAQLSQLIFIKTMRDASSNFDYYDLTKKVGRKVIRKFIKEIVKKIYFDHSRLVKIEFTNGQTITLIY